MKKDILIKVENLTKDYGSNGLKVRIIDKVNLKIYRKEFVVIMGPSGAGKSTLLYMISGLDNPTNGKIKFEEKDIANLNDREKVYFRKQKFGFVFQNPNLLADLTIFENTLLPVGNSFSKRSEIKERVLTLLKNLAIEKHKDKYPAQLSGGEQQRASVARALINKPEVLFADEPTGALNSKQSDSLLKLFSELNKEGQTIVMVTHDIKTAAYADRIIYLKNGDFFGELDLTKYASEKIADKEKIVFEFLSGKGW